MTEKISLNKELKKMYKQRDELVKKYDSLAQSIRECLTDGMVHHIKNIAIQIEIAQDEIIDIDNEIDKKKKRTNEINRELSIKESEFTNLFNDLEEAARNHKLSFANEILIKLNTLNNLITTLKSELN